MGFNSFFRHWLLTLKLFRRIRAINELLHNILGTISTREKFEAKRLEMPCSPSFMPGYGTACREPDGSWKIKN